MLGGPQMGIEDVGVQRHDPPASAGGSCRTPDRGDCELEGDADLGADDLDRIGLRELLSARDHDLLS